MKIVIETIPHKKHRYCTVGDYWIEKDGTIQVRVSKMNDKYERAVILHELFELFSVIDSIPLNSIDEFDIAFEALRKKYPKIIGDMEPGDMVSAPYHQAHIYATEIEKMFCTLNGIDWNKYNDKINSL
jgi:hypothetical protein